MWLQHFINGAVKRCLAHSRIGLSIAAMLALSACGSSATQPNAPSDAQPVRSGTPTPAAMDTTAADGEGLIGPEIPAEAMTLYEQATAVMASGDFLEAELRLQDFLLRYPQFPGAHVNLAIIHANNGNDAAAQAEIDAALALNPNHAAALNQQGQLFRRNGKFMEAEAAYLKAVTAAPNYALAHYNLGVLNELYLQRLDSALMHFEQYQSLVGEDKQVEKWIADLRRRVAATQRTANVAE
ncbi:MAG: tetratricopeptide repeat protein [Pseudomonadota bacterium]